MPTLKKLAPKPKVKQSLLTLKEVCEELRISRAYLYVLFKNNKGPKRTVVSQRKIYVARKHLNEWIDRKVNKAEV